MSKQKTIVDQLRQAIEKSELTRYRIAKDAGITQIVLDRFVSGERDLRLGTAAKIAAVLNLVLVSRK